MKYIVLLATVFITLNSFSQNLSYKIIFDSINPLLEKGNYKEAKALWISTESKYKIDPQQEYLFICESLINDDITFFKERILKLMEKAGVSFTPGDSLPQNLNGYNTIFYDKGVMKWLIEKSTEIYPKWIAENPEAYQIRCEIEFLVLKDQYIRSNFAPSDFADSACVNEDKYWETVGRADFMNMAELTTLCIQNEGIPNHFDHGTKSFYFMGIIIWHNLKNPTNRENAWNMIVPWLDKAYFEGKIDSGLYASYDKWLFEHTGYQYYGFEGSAPILKPETFSERKEKYKF